MALHHIRIVDARNLPPWIQPQAVVPSGLKATPREANPGSSPKPTGHRCVAEGGRGGVEGRDLQIVADM
jgi:hypothetical protein